MNAKTKHTEADITIPTIKAVDAPMPTATRGRTRTATQFDPIVAALEVDSGNGKRFTVPVAALPKVRRQLTSAGNALNPPVTVSWNVTTKDDVATVVIAAKTKIRKERKAR